MKKIILVISILLAALIGKSQTDTTSKPIVYTQGETTYRTVEDTPGNRLIQSANLAQVGMTLSLAGSLLIAFPAIMPTENRDPQKIEDRSKQLTTIGIVTTVVGSTIYFISFSSIRNAGKRMNEERIKVGINNNGVGVTIPIR